MYRCGDTLSLVVVLPMCSVSEIEGFEAPMHRAVAEPLLLGGAPGAITIVNGTIAAALGLGLQQWIAGLVMWAAGHTLAVFAAKRDPDFAPDRKSTRLNSSH